MTRQELDKILNILLEVDGNAFKVTTVFDSDTHRKTGDGTIYILSISRLCGNTIAKLVNNGYQLFYSENSPLTVHGPFEK